MSSLSGRRNRSPGHIHFHSPSRVKTPGAILFRMEKTFISVGIAYLHVAGVLASYFCWRYAAGHRIKSVRAADLFAIIKTWAACTFATGMIAYITSYRHGEDQPDLMLTYFIELIIPAYIGLFKGFKRDRNLSDEDRDAYNRHMDSIRNDKLM